MSFILGFCPLFFERYGVSSPYLCHIFQKIVFIGYVIGNIYSLKVHWTKIINFWTQIYNLFLFLMCIFIYFDLFWYLLSSVQFFLFLYILNYTPHHMNSESEFNFNIMNISIINQMIRFKGSKD